MPNHLEQADKATQAKSAHENVYSSLAASAYEPKGFPPTKPATTETENPANDVKQNPSRAQDAIARDLAEKQADLRKEMTQPAKDVEPPHGDKPMAAQSEEKGWWTRGRSEKTDKEFYAMSEIVAAATKAQLDPYGSSRAAQGEGKDWWNRKMPSLEIVDDSNKAIFTDKH